MTTDNRTNEPTPEQVEAAAKAIHALTEGDPFEDYHPDWKEMLRTKARAALVAAQGAAPQAESAHQHEGWMIRETGTGGYYCSSCGEPVTDPRAPVLPSSGVDVAKIESLILGRTATAGARAVAEWLDASTTRKEQER